MPLSQKVDLKSLDSYVPLASPNEPTAHSAMAAIPSLRKPSGEIAATITAAKVNAATSAQANKINKDSVFDNVVQNGASQSEVNQTRINNLMICKHQQQLLASQKKSSIGVTGVPNTSLAVGHHVAPAISRLNNTGDSNDNTTNPSLHMTSLTSRNHTNSAILTGSVATAVVAAVATGGGQLSSVYESLASASGGERKRGESIIGMIRDVGITMRRRSELLLNLSEKSVLIPSPQHHQHGEKDIRAAVNNQMDSDRSRTFRLSDRYFARRRRE
ncbi:hypothetical protein HK100_011479 [Physocladia obscura]|uniref:Uncharacterized protein n=1 Tax=Physocladia obscura TaxID=109957 RepID=A0AAD5XD76_9FUNG|nr:hypothetical protein HK100_011479 [Physocladia obscura]